MLHLGRTLRDAGELREAEHVLTTLLSLQHRAGDEGDDRILRTEFNLAIVLDRLGEYDAARRVWERVLGASDREHGPDSQLSVRTATNLAITLRKQHRYGDEFPLRVRGARGNARCLLGPDHVDTSMGLVELAQTQRNLGNHEMALSLFTEALSGLERSGVDHRAILTQKWAIVTELVALKRSKEASAMFDQVVTGSVEHLILDDPLRRSALRQRRAYWLLGKTPRTGRKSRRRGRPVP